MPPRRTILGWSVLLALLIACSQQQPAATPALTGTLPISAPQTAAVGEAVTVTVGPVAGADGASATLVAQSSYGTQAYQAPFRNGIASFELRSEQTRRSGVVTLHAVSGAARGRAVITLQPGRAVEPLTPLVGPRSITADGQQFSVVVAIPFDEFGNPVAERTPVTIRVRRPDQQVDEQTTAVRHLLAWARIRSGTRAGQTTISVSTQQVYGPEASVLEAAGLPISATLEAEPGTAPADGRTLVTVRTDVLTDRFGNVLPDGTLVTFVAEAPADQRRFLPAYTINGVAETPLQAPTEPGILTIRATVYDVESAPLQIPFTPGPAVESFPLIARTNTAGGAIVLEAGPILGQLQQTVPDGTPVLFHIPDAPPGQQWLQAVSEAGRARVELRLAQLAAGSYAVEAVAGSGRGSATFSVPPK